ncbi:MAG: tocopherol cyclase family protein [bacterium]
MSNLWRPEAFQGKGKTNNYFEGWYFKSVSADEKTAIAVIPGISLSKDATKSHAFIMVVDARRHKLSYTEYPLSEFSSDETVFNIKIGQNSFSLNHMHLDIQDGKKHIKADLKFSTIIPWPVTRFSPGTMGWYAFVPLMECYHATVSFDHRISGQFQIVSKKIDFTGGKGYLEKDWGRSMPSSWIWMQTNHFDEDGVSLFGSVAKVPWLGNSFTGYIFGVLHRSQLYKFTTYTGAKITKLTVDENHIVVHIQDKQHILEITADRAEGIDLPAPKLGEMTAKVNESLKSKIQIELYKKTKTGRIEIFSGQGRNAGLEFVGDIKELLKGFK